MSKKATKYDMLRREKLIIDLMGRGTAPKEIWEEVARLEKVSPRTIETQYYQILKEMKKSVSEDRDELRAQLMTQQSQIFNKALEAGALKTALDATQAKAKLAGLYEVEASKDELPKAILVKEKDFSQKLEVVPPPKAENDK